MKNAITTEKAPAAIGPYSQAVVVKDVIYVSGQLPVKPENQIMPEEVKEQTLQSLKNIKVILEAAGFSLKDVAKATVYLEDMNDFAAMNDVYKDFFSNPYPARVAVEVARLPKDAKIEIDVIASK